MRRGCFKKNPNSMRARIEALLLEHTGMTMSDIHEELPEYTKGGVSKIICDLHDAGVIYVKDWEMAQPGQRPYPRPVWDHASHSKRQPPHDKGKPFPVTEAVRSRRRRRTTKRNGNELRLQCIFKMIRPTSSEPD